MMPAGGQLQLRKYMMSEWARSVALSGSQMMPCTRLTSYQSKWIPLLRFLSVSWIPCEEPSSTNLSHTESYQLEEFSPRSITSSQLIIMQAYACQICGRSCGRRFGCPRCQGVHVIYNVSWARYMISWMVGGRYLSLSSIIHSALLLL